MENKTGIVKEIAELIKTLGQQYAPSIIAGVMVIISNIHYLTGIAALFVVLYNLKIVYFKSELVKMEYLDKKR